MSDTGDYVLAALRKHIEARRRDIAAKFPRKLGRSEYHRNCGRHEELEALASALQEAVRKANDLGGDGDEKDEGTQG